MPLPTEPSACPPKPFLKLGSFFVDLEVEAATSLGSLLLAFSPTLASFILLAQRLAAASPRSPQHGVSTEQYISVCWSKKMLDLGGFGPGLLTSSAYFLTMCWPTPSASSERLKSFQVLQFFWALSAEAQSCLSVRESPLLRL